MNDVAARMESYRPVETVSPLQAVWRDDTWYMEVPSAIAAFPTAAITTTYSEVAAAPDTGTPNQIAPHRSRQMNVAELREHIEVLRAQGVDVRKYEVDLHLKYALPMASLVFALVAAPLGMQPTRSASSIGFGLSIVIIFLYYVFMSLGSALGQAGTLPPALGGWLQNIVIGGTGVFLIIRQGG